MCTAVQWANEKNFEALASGFGSEVPIFTAIFDGFIETLGAVHADDILGSGYKPARTFFVFSCEHVYRLAESEN